jgi:quinol-cytochrome oxidoreductase complex cytochrome b subunit
MKYIINILDYLNTRLGFTSMHRKVMDKPVPGWINYFYCFGGIAFTLYLVLLLTGLLLSVHYTPSEAGAYRSIQRMQQVVPLGGLFRSLHRWAAYLMIVMVVLHMLRVFITGSYKKPRELTWVAGCLLLMLTLAFGFTGYLLLWDQKAYWATVIGTNMLGSTPFIGQYLADFARGGAEVTGDTLLRFYSLHVIWFPLLVALLLWVHFHIIRKLGISGRM